MMASMGRDRRPAPELQQARRLIPNDGAIMNKPHQPAAHDPMRIRTRVLVRYLRPLALAYLADRLLGV